METSYIAILLLLIALLILHNQQRSNNNAAAIKAIQRKKQKGNSEMLELAKKFIDKECILYTFNSQQIEGIIKEINGNAVLLENNGTVEAINLDFVLRIREFPKKKNGKKKSVVLD